jgi:signal transduction histidine kinase
VRVEFAHCGIPHNLQKEGSTCVFRVVQEALQNAVKPSLAREFDVELRGESDEIHPTISDM